mmetsp:Transcript_15307/g.29681  ORF Transcript_15307/g.29681 Transcript_15307/m.29681 type:complete len:264 (+) Transcript_15307:1115-1906(+)
MVRSKRPGRRMAGSRMSTRLVPASTTTPSLEVKPSISTRSWFNVFSRSSLPPLKPPFPRARATASISSMKTMQGAFLRACPNKSRTREGPTPTNISIKSLPEMEKKGTLASPAVALARRVLPVPGGPARRAPLGILAPSLVKRLGSFKNSTNSMISTLASSHPATSLKVTPTFLSLPSICAGDLPTLKMLDIPPPPPAPPPMLRIMKTHAAIMRNVGASLESSASQLVSLTYCTGTKLLERMPSSRCASSSLRSKLSMLPMVK